MTISDRIRQIRRSLSLTQAEFGSELGTKRDNITSIEIGRVMPNGIMITAICSKFNVNQHWLLHGTGDMFLPLSKNEEITSFIKNLTQHNDQQFIKNFLVVLTKLNSDDWKSIEKIITLLQAEIQKEDK